MPIQDIAGAMRGAGRLAQALRGAQTLARIAKQFQAANTDPYQPGGNTGGGGGNGGGAVGAPVVSTLASLPQSPLLNELVKKGLIKEGMPVEQALAILQLGQMRGGVAIDVEALMKEIQADYENYSGDIFGDAEQWMKDLYGTAMPNANDPNSALFRSDPIWADTAGGLSQIQETGEQNLQTDLNWFRKQQAADQAYYDQMMSGIASGTIPLGDAEAGGGGGGGGGGGRRGYRRYGGGGSSGGDDVRNTMQIDDTFQTTAKDQYYENFPGFYRDVLSAAAGNYDFANNPGGYAPEMLDMFQRVADAGVSPELIEETQFLLDTEGDPEATQAAMAERIRELTEGVEGWGDVDTMNRAWEQQAPAEWMGLLEDLKDAGYVQGDNPFTENVEPTSTEFRLPFEASAQGLGSGFVPTADQDQATELAQFVNEAIKGRLGGRHYNVNNITRFLRNVPKYQELARGYLAQNQPPAVGGTGAGNTLSDVNSITDIATRLAANQAGPGTGLAPMDAWPDIIQNFNEQQGPGPGLAPMEGWPDIISNYWDAQQQNQTGVNNAGQPVVTNTDLPATANAGGRYDPLSSAVPRNNLGLPAIEPNVPSIINGEYVGTANDPAMQTIDPFGGMEQALIDEGVIPGPQSYQARVEASDAVQAAIRNARSVLPFQSLMDRGHGAEWLRDAIRSRLGLPMTPTGTFATPQLPNDLTAANLNRTGVNQAGLTPEQAADVLRGNGPENLPAQAGSGVGAASGSPFGIPNPIDEDNAWHPGDPISASGDFGLRTMSPIMQAIQTVVNTPTPDGGAGDRESAHDRWLMMNAMADNGMSVEDAIARMHGDASIPLSPEYQATARWPNPAGLTAGSGSAGGSSGQFGFPGGGGLDLTGLIANRTQQQEPTPGPTSPYDIVGAAKGAKALSNAAKIATIFNAQRQQAQTSGLPAPEQGQSFAEYGVQNWGNVEDMPDATLNSVDAATVGSNRLSNQNLLDALMGRVTYTKEGLLQPGVKDPLALRNYNQYRNWVADQNFISEEQAETTPYPTAGGVHYQPHEISEEENAQNAQMRDDLRLMKDIVGYGYNPNVGPAQVYSSYQEQNRQNVQGERYQRDYEPGTTQALAEDPQAFIQDLLSGMVPETDLPETYSSDVQLGLGGGDFGYKASNAGLAGVGSALRSGLSNRDDSVYKIVNAASELRNRQLAQEQAAATAAAAARRVGQAAQAARGARNVQRATQTATNMQGALRGMQRLAEVLRRFRR